MITPQLRKAQKALDEQEKRARAERESLEVEFSRARELQKAWADHEAAVMMERKAQCYVLSKIEIMKARVQRASEVIARMAPEYEYSDDYFQAQRSAPTEDSPSTFMKWGGKNPFVYYGCEIAGCEAAIRALQGTLALIESNERKAVAAAVDFALKNGIQPDEELRHDMEIEQEKRRVMKEAGLAKGGSAEAA